MQKPISFTLHDIITAAQSFGGSDAFQNALRFTLPQEGLYCEHVVNDAGGDTCCGVDQPDFDFYRKQHGLPPQSVFNAGAADIAAVYYANHWRPLGCDNYQYSVALAMFDDGVNQGNGQSVKNLQRALGVTADGIIGSGTMAAEHDYVVKHGAASLSSAMIAQRRHVYQLIVQAHPEDQKFLGGWMQRCNDLAGATAA